MQMEQPGDKILMRDTMASMLLISMILYILIAFIVTLIFGSVGGLVISATHI